MKEKIFSVGVQKSKLLLKIFECLQTEIMGEKPEASMSDKHCVRAMSEN